MSETWNLSEHGTPFEKKNVEWIRQNIPAYERYWARYTGAVQDGRIFREAEIHGITVKRDRMRKRLGQWNYSALMNCFHLLELWKATHKSDYEIKRSLEFERIYFLAVSLFYNGINCLQKVQSILNEARVKADAGKKNDKKKKRRDKTKGKHIPINLKVPGLKELRDAMIHNIRPLVQVDINKGEFQVACNLGFFENRADDWIWSDTDFFKDLQYKPISAFIWDLLQSLKDETNKIINEELRVFLDLGIKELIPPSPVTTTIPPPQATPYASASAVPPESF
ncbi:MAG: hypothetical protein OEQ53_18265 [Saprospiraceae bacterium]|nr:hypothetical protein [Saprospiraceae bacterium]